MMTYNQVVLIILDGWGHREDSKHNAIAEARTPFFDSLIEKYPHSLLDASSSSVGLPEGQIGNSEVGHMTIGAGKVIDTDLVRINKAVTSGEFETNPAFVQLFDHVKKNNSVLHVLGLVSPGGVHSHQDHLHAFLRAAKKAGISQVVIHAFTDGRDVPPQSAHEYLRELERVIAEVGLGFIATATGRFYAMDRDKNWDRVAKAEAAIFEGEGKVAGAQKPSAALELLHGKGMLDEHLEPVIFLDDTGKNYQVSPHDGMFFFNYRADRARQISQRVIERTRDQDILFVTLTEYEAGMNSVVAFPPQKIETTLAAEVSKAGLSQAHIAETEKYAHATYFLNGGREEKHPGEEHILIESRKDVKTHDEAPEMRAREIADEAIRQIEKGTNFIFINFANADMVGHTGKKDAIVKAVEEVDHQLSRVIGSSLSRPSCAVFITADHGNAETNVDPATGVMHTAHTTNFVPAIATADYGKLVNGGLADVAPTILHLLGLPQPEAMTGKNLSITE